MKKPEWLDQVPVGKLLRIFVIWRILLFLIVALASANIPYNQTALYTGPENIAEHSSWFAQRFLYPAANFDGVHYLQIAIDGYVDQARFLPLYPLIIRALAAPLLHATAFNPLVISLALIVTNVFTFLALIWLYKLVQLDYKKDLGLKVVVAALSFPTAFFFVSVYTEGIFLALVTYTLYHWRIGNLKRAVIAAMILTIVRLQGIVIMLPMLIELYSLKKHAQFKSRLLLILVTPFPLFLYAVFNYLRWDNPLFFVTAHTLLGNARTATHFVFPLQTAWRYLKILSETWGSQAYSFWIAVLELTTTVVSGLFLAIGYRSTLKKSLWWFALILWLVPSITGTFSGMPRYVLTIFPLYIVGLQKIPPRFEKLAVVVSLALQILLVISFSRGYLIG